MGRDRGEAAYILDRMRVAGMERVYVLGCRAQRVTVQSQQYRAFNLIWALFEKGLLREGDRLGVIGGGIGGLTAAAAALVKGCRVSLVEANQELMHLQRGNFTRLLHPNVYEWPAKGAEIEITALPCMNWSADFAGTVVDALEEEWKALVCDFAPDVRMRTEVTGVEPTGAGGRLKMTSDDWDSDPCEIVVVAVGFGVEPPVSAIESDTYWDNDKLEQSPKGYRADKRVLVSGLGDGACIDVLRMKYSRFNHRTFADAVMRHPQLQRCRRRLLEIDLRLPDSGQAVYLRDAYAKLGLPADLAGQLGTLRDEIHVVLNGSAPAPFSAKACILHRVAIWALHTAGRLEYKQGKLDLEGITHKPATTGVSYMVAIPAVGGTTRFDKVVVRHGPMSCLRGLPTIEQGYKGIVDKPLKDKTRRQLYTSGFYPTKRHAPPSAARLTSLPLADALARVAKRSETLDVPQIAGAEPRPMEVGGPSVARVPYVASESPPGEIRVIVGTLRAETRAQNYPQAREAADQLEALLTRPRAEVPPDAWHDANKELVDFELFARQRVESSGGTYDLARLKQLIERMESGNISTN